MKRLRAIPSVEKVLQALGQVSLPRLALLTVIRRELALVRKGNRVPPFERILDQVRMRVDRLMQSRIQPVINGTGIIVHTNLGRAPLAQSAMEALRDIGPLYNTLEFNIADGQRGPRAPYLEHQLAVLCGAEAATTVNNCAAALVLILRHCTSGERKEVLISRGELIQIGGGFRIPEILETSGAQLREVGTTNRTTVADYARAISRHTACILKVHRSNFFMTGFVDSPAGTDLAGLAKRKGVVLVEDLGSGAVVPTQKLGTLEHEPTPAEVLRQGVELVCFSGDKLLGGPQAGLIAGRARRIASLKGDPIFRALRCDKLILAALEATVDLYLTAAGSEGLAARIPVLELAQVPLDVLRLRAIRLVERLGGLPLQAAVGSGKSKMGGGTLPQSVIGSITLDLTPQSITLAEFAARLRRSRPPLIGYPAAGRYKLDLRTIYPSQEDSLVQTIRTAALGGHD